MDKTVDQILPADAIERDIAQATELRDRWTRYLAEFHRTGAGRLRIGTKWETKSEAIARLQGVVDNHTRTVELLTAFRASYPADDR